MESKFQPQVRRICSSEVFRTTPRLRDFLVFLTSRHTQNDAQGLKETVIGVEFFDRRPGYDPKKDPIVRVEAHRLRQRLREYYSGEGAGESLQVHLPKGSYALSLRRKEDLPPEWRLAVLVDASDQLTAEGLTVELISRLGELHGVTVLAPRSSLAIHSAREAVRDLGANVVLECSLDGFNLQATLSRDDSAGLIPIGTFDNVIQPAIEALSRFVGTSLGAGSRATARKRSFIDRESYQLYLSGRAWFHRWSPDNLAHAASHFERVIEKCPDHAPAYAGMADIQVLLAYWHVPSARSTLEQGRQYAAKALTLDPNCADACCSMAAFEATLNRDWAASEGLFRRALEGNPSSALALNWLSIITLVPLGRFEEAVDLVFAAYDLDPASPEIGNEIVWVRINCRQFEEAAEQGRRIIALHPSFLEAYWSLGIAESALGHFSAAFDALDQAEKLVPDVPFTFALRSYVEGMGGNSSAARDYFDRLQKCSRPGPVRELFSCWALTGMGELEAAMQHLQLAVDAADPLALYLDVFVLFDRLRVHPRFEQLRQQQRLTTHSLSISR
jgi:tetratricopeptide (TPR) repeat protein